MILAPPAVELRGIDKRFGAIHANRAVDLTVRRGSIHGLIGENGAGKSTLMSVLYGFYAADAGTVRVGGRALPPGDSEAAIAAGLAMVHQHFMLVDEMKVLENVMLGIEGGFSLRSHMRQAREKIAALGRDYGLLVDPDARVENLPIGARQRVEIVRALYRGAETLILDEPTGVLTPNEATDLFRVLAALRAQGRTVLLVTHKLREIMAITDRVSVMRAGAMVAERDTADTSPEELGELMIGRRLATALPRGDTAAGGTALSVRNLVVREASVERVRGVTFDVRAGEIVGVAGVSGNGQSELLEALAGMRPRDGDVLVDGAPLPALSPAAARAAGLGHVPEDRLRTGLLAPFAARESVILGHSDDRAWRHGPLLDWRGIERHSQALMTDYDVRPPVPRLRAAGFSGGNQQKLILGREVERTPRVLLVGQPTRGVDIGGIDAIHRRLLDLRAAGCAILLVSVELDEILRLSDRVLVMSDGRITGETTPARADERQLGLMMSGIAA